MKQNSTTEPGENTERGKSSWALHADITHKILKVFHERYEMTLKPALDALSYKDLLHGPTTCCVEAMS